MSADGFSFVHKDSMNTCELQPRSNIMAVMLNCNWREWVYIPHDMWRIQIFSYAFLLINIATQLHNFTLRTKQHIKATIAGFL